MKKILFLLINIFCVLLIFSQEPIIPTKKIYKDQNGKIFVNKTLPLYFKISQNISPQSEHKLLVSKNTRRTTNPVYLNKEGLNIFFSPSAVDTITKKTIYPKQDVIFEFYADSKSPITKIHNSIISYEKNEIIYFGQNLKIHFTAKDKISGVENTYYSINEQNYQKYTNDTLKNFEHDQTYTIKYYSTDHTGNYEQIKQVKFKIDTARPLTNLVITGKHKENIINNNCSVTLKPQDAFSGTAKTYYYIDNQTKRIYSKPIKVKNLHEGNHTLYYYTEDNVRNIENVKSYSFYIDKTPPMLIEEIIGDYTYMNGQAYTSGRSQLQLTAIDNKSGLDAIYYSLDGKNWQKYEKPFLLPSSNKKDVKIYYYAIDKVGNETKFDENSIHSLKHFASQLDLNPPNITHNYQGEQIKIFDTTYISPNTKIKLTAIDDKAGIKNLSYQINKNNNTNYNAPFEIKDAGYHNITAFATDKVNNIASNNFSVIIDNTAPEIFANFSIHKMNINGTESYPQGTKLYFLATDNYTGIQKITYTLNNQPEKAYTNCLTFNDLGNYNLTIKAQDKVGNINKKQLNFVIK